MSHDAIDLMPARILVIDDERHVHASLRVRLAGEHDLTCCLAAGDALQRVSQERFDLCFVDIQMPDIDGLKFIDAARNIDPQLGYVVLSAFDTDENLRRTIPLQVYDFIPKPLPSRPEFEGRIHDWVEATRKRRREHELAQSAGTIACERDTARMERDVELVASESARDALLQVAGLLTTINAHYLHASSFLRTRTKSDPSLMSLLRAMEEGKRAAEAVVSVTEGFLGSAYGDRDSSPALVNEGIRNAISMVTREPSIQQNNKTVHFAPLDLQLPLRGLSGIAFLLMIFPALAAALNLSPSNTTVGVRGYHYTRISEVLKDCKRRTYLWLNRRNALLSHSGWLIEFSSSSEALKRTQVESWLKGDYAPLATITPRGIVDGIQRCHGLLGFSLSPATDQFRLCLVLPT